MQTVIIECSPFDFVGILVTAEAKAMFILFIFNDKLPSGEKTRQKNDKGTERFHFWTINVLLKKSTFGVYVQLYQLSSDSAVAT